jgi:hypothetical protein
MSEVLKRIWKEPAVFIGLLASVVLAILTVVTGDPWNASTIAGVAAPFLSSLGIRQLVTPAEETKPEVKK